jgi:hypothetical protein
MKLATEEKRFVAMRKIMQYAHDLERDPNLARLRTTMKNRLETRVDEKMFRAKKDFHVFAKRESIFVHDETEHSMTDSSLRTIVEKP